jgi:hypothetical protein
MVVNSIAYGNGSGYGINASAGGTVQNDSFCDYNAFGGNLSSYNGISAGAHDVSLSGNPFDVAAIAALTSNSGADVILAAFRPNATINGGGLLRAAGYPPYGDIGAAQHLDTGGVGPAVIF